MSFADKLKKSTIKNNSLLCLGLDPALEKLPDSVKKGTNPLFSFNKAIIDQTHDLVCVYKLNSAFYEALGDIGIKQLKMSCDFLRENFPQIPIIIDAKRGDIGNTNEAYAQYVFSYLLADGITVMPYMGIESLDAYFNHAGKGIIIACHSSNTGAKEFQDLLVDNKPLYQIVALEILKRHGDNPNCMIFMGATFPQELKQIRKIVSDMTILVPGIGAQKGNLEEVIKAGINSKNRGLMINSSRSIIYASNDGDFAKKARIQAQNLKNLINEARDI